MRTRRGHRRYLLVTALVIGGLAPVFAAAGMERLSEPARWSLDLLSWPVDDEQRYDEPTTRFLSSLAGGFLLGWAVLVLCLRSFVHHVAPEAVRRSVVTSLGAWFVLDSAASVASGNASNALFNVVVLAIAVGPLAWPAVEPGEPTGG